MHTCHVVHPQDKIREVGPLQGLGTRHDGGGGGGGGAGPRLAADERDELAINPWPDATMQTIM